MTYAVDTESDIPKQIISDRVKKILQNTVKLGNIIMGVFGILILLYAAWMFVFCMKNYQQYIFSAWFLWACAGTGIVYIVMGLLGHAAASSRRRFVLTYYVGLKSVLLFIEAIITGDIFLNDHWKKDFPVDPTQRFENFVAYARLHAKIFNIMAATLLISQAASYLLAIFLRTMFARFQLHTNNTIAGVPFLDGHIVTLPYAVVGYPYSTSNEANVDIKKKDNQLVPHSQKEIWLKSVDGYAPVTNNVD